MHNLFSKQHPDEASSACCNPFSLVKQEAKAKKLERDRELAKEVAEEMNSLSLQEREKATDDVHGVAKVHEETPAFIESRLQAFDAALKRLPVKMKRDLNKAFFLRPSLETDRDFKLMFLRADEYNVVDAAIRMVNFFKQKYELFGDEKLGKRITMDDLSEGDLNVLRSGHVFVLPLKDQIGRPILFCDGNKLDFNRMTTDNIIRAVWYVAMAAIHQDEVGQKKGFAAIAFTSSGAQIFRADMIAKATSYVLRSGAFMCSLPFRYSSIHWCGDDTRIEILMKTMRLSYNKDFRLRLSAHFENEYRLITYGIQSQGLLQSARAGDKTLLHQYLQRRLEGDQQLEDDTAREEAESGLAQCPRPEDVLIGRGGPYRTHPGTMIWDKLILSNLDRYIHSTNFEKTCLSMEIVKQIQESGGRVLQRSKEGWKILNDTNARDKAAIGFRSRGGGVSAKMLPPRTVSSLERGNDPKRLRTA